MFDSVLISLSIGTIISGVAFWKMSNDLRAIKSEISGLKLSIHKNMKQISNYDSYLESISHATKDRVKNLEIILHEFCSKKMPTVEEMEKIYDKLKREVTEHKKLMKKDSQKIEMSAEDLKKKMVSIAMNVSQIDQAVNDIRRVSINDFDEYRDMVEKEIKANQEAVFNRLQDIARDFHVLASKLTDGSIKEMKILSEKEYLKLKKV